MPEELGVTLYSKCLPCKQTELGEEDNRRTNANMPVTNIYHQYQGFPAVHD